MKISAQKQIVCFSIFLLLIFACGSKKSTEPEVENPAPKITVQPTVTDIGISSAVITWETDVVANSTVRYDTIQGEYSLSEINETKEKIHQTFGKY